MLFILALFFLIVMFLLIFAMAFIDDEIAYDMAEEAAGLAGLISFVMFLLGIVQLVVT